MDVGAEIASLTGGRGADIIMDQCVGEDFCRQLDYLAPMGTILVYNHQKGFPTENVVKAMTDRFAACPGVRVFSAHYFDDKPELLAQYRRQVFDLLAQGKIRPHVGASFPLEEAVQAHTLLDTGRCLGGIVLRM